MARTNEPHRDADRVVRDEESEYPTQCENCCRKQGYFGGPPSVTFAHIFGVRSSSKNWHPSSISVLPTTLLKQANKMILQNHVWKLIALFLNIFDVFYSMVCVVSFQAVHIYIYQ